MTSPQIPSPNEFVVGVREGGLEEALADRPEGTKPGAILDDRSFLIELTAPADPRVTWKRLVNQIRSAEWVSPVVLDEEKVSHYPTGDVTVRFRDPISDGDLERFAKSNGLELRSRNEFIAEQASFRPRDQRGTYLPDLVEQLQRDDAVGTAWLNTKSAYKRA